VTPDDSGTDVLLQADALMRRHRTFLAGGDIEQRRSAVFEAVSQELEDDLPVLTEVVALDKAGETVTTRESEQALVSHQQYLADSLEKWLDEELPQVILSVLDGFSDKLIAELVSKARAALLPRLLDPKTYPDEP
jgi:hypothetical protein